MFWVISESKNLGVHIDGEFESLAEARSFLEDAAYEAALIHPVFWVEPTHFEVSTLAGTLSCYIHQQD